MAKSQDLRHRIVDLVATAASRRPTARHFQVSASLAIRVAKPAEEVGHVRVKPRKPWRNRIDLFDDGVKSWIAERPDLTVQELSGRLAQVHGMTVAVSTLDDWLCITKITYQ